MTIKLPVCTSCGKTQYPVREICGECLSDQLEWLEIRAEGELLASVPLYHSLEEFFQERLPWPIGSVRLEDGTVMMVNPRRGTYATRHGSQPFGRTGLQGPHCLLGPQEGRNK